MVYISLIVSPIISQIDKFSDLKTLNISKETKIYRHSWKRRAKISITAKFEEEIIFIIPEPTARSAVRRGLLIPHGYLHPGKSKHSEVKSPSMIAGASLWFVVQEAWVVISLIS